MRGSPYLRRAVRAHLEQHLNDTVAAMAADQDLKVCGIEEWHDSFITKNRVDRWPVLMVTAYGGVNRGRIDWENGSPIHQWDWTLRVWIWARGETYLDTADRAELIATAAVETLTARPGLSDGNDRARVITEGDAPFRVSLSDTQPVPKERASIAGAYLEFVVTMAEIAGIPALGTATDLTVTVEPKEPS